MSLDIRPAADCRWDAISLGEVMRAVTAKGARVVR